MKGNTMEITKDSTISCECCPDTHQEWFDTNHYVTLEDRIEDVIMFAKAVEKAEDDGDPVVIDYAEYNLHWSIIDFTNHVPNTELRNF
jgi:hypothetical protein